MRKYILSLIALIVAGAVHAQDPTTTWPYLYNDFMQGTVYFKDGSHTDYLVNIHVLNSKLHYLEQGSEDIKEAVSKDVVLVTVGNDSFYARQGKILKAVASNDKGFIGEESVADMAALMSEGSAAYGASANSMSTRKLTSIEGAGPSASTNHMNLKKSKDDGKLIPLEREYYIVTAGQVYPANKRELELFLPSEKRAGLKAFLKANKISWNSPQSLLKLIDYING